ncbi:MAG: hypothetical protein QJR03_12190, partial [Sphaerobacter sp.]|nr:hypothetical protein [Sphaerobacter sp.]
MPLLTSLTHLGIGKETTWGTPVAASKWMPVKNPKPEDVAAWVDDVGLRGVPSQTFAKYLNRMSSTYEFDGDFFPDVPPYLLLGILGNDTVTGTGPYTHTFALL